MKEERLKVKLMQTKLEGRQDKDQYNTRESGWVVQTSSLTSHLLRGAIVSLPSLI